MTRQELDAGALEPLLRALPDEDPVLALREVMAFGDDARPREPHAHQWFVAAAVAEVRAPRGTHGPQAILTLARHLREHGQEPPAYAQADDLWSIARHRAFLAAHADARAQRDENGALAAWVAEHGAPLAKRWGHIAPLVMQATLALGAGRPASASVPDTLEALAALERDAAASLPPGEDAAASADRARSVGQ